MPKRRRKDSWGDAVGDAEWASYLEPAPGELRIVQAFLNTVDLPRGREELTSPEALADWLRRWQLVAEDAELTDADLELATEVRRDLRILVRAGPRGNVEREVTTRLDRAAAGARLRVRFPGGRAIRIEPVDSGFDGALGRLLRIVAQAHVEKQLARLKLCPADDCGRVFYDSSPNLARKWCSMQRCGNRSKARVFRRRHPGYAAHARSG